jgi:hypothetical protein
MNLAEASNRKSPFTGPTSWNTTNGQISQTGGLDAGKHGFHGTRDLRCWTTALRDLPNPGLVQKGWRAGKDPLTGGEQIRLSDPLEVALFFQDTRV